MHTICQPLLIGITALSLGCITELDNQGEASKRERPTWERSPEHMPELGDDDGNGAANNDSQSNDVVQDAPPLPPGTLRELLLENPRVGGTFGATSLDDRADWASAILTDTWMDISLETYANDSWGFVSFIVDGPGAQALFEPGLYVLSDGAPFFVSTYAEFSTADWWGDRTGSATFDVHENPFDPEKVDVTVSTSFDAQPQATVFASFTTSRAGAVGVDLNDGNSWPGPIDHFQPAVEDSFLSGSLGNFTVDEVGTSALVYLDPGRRNFHVEVQQPNGDWGFLSLDLMGGESIELEPGSYEFGALGNSPQNPELFATVIGCSGEDGNMDWDVPAAETQVDIAVNPDDPTLMDVTFTARFFDEVGSVGTASLSYRVE